MKLDIRESLTSPGDAQLTLCRAIGVIEGGPGGVRRRATARRS